MPNKESTCTLKLKEVSDIAILLVTIGALQNCFTRRGSIYYQRNSCGLPEHDRSTACLLALLWHYGLKATELSIALDWFSLAEPIP